MSALDLYDFSAFEIPEDVESVNAFKSERKFTVWDVLASKGNLLLRGPGQDFHLDLIFHDVFWLELPLEMTGLEIKSPRRAKLARLQTRLGRTLKPNEHIFVLSSGTERYHIGARALYIEKCGQQSIDPDFYHGKYLYQSTHEDFYKTHVMRRLQFKFPQTRGRSKRT